MNRQGKYQGAWLTDIDDTLIPSGHRPSDPWIDQLAVFIRNLSRHGILWAPVSGVDIVKMGPRMLYRLPEDTLEHVVYFGGEGSTKSFYDSEQKKWASEPSYQRNFSDAQALALIGEQRFSQVLQLHYSAQNLKDPRILERIQPAKKRLSAQQYDIASCLIDELEEKLSEAGLNPKKAETYYRGGAISWMMLGDISVRKYKGEHETLTRHKLNQYLRERLTSLNGLQEIGDSAVHMPYLHATRGIKMVLQGNDKGRAAESLIADDQISASSLLFVGNELFEGGNDSSVLRVDGVNVLSVGEKEISGVTNGGNCVDDNAHWMQWVAQGLDNGQSWKQLLADLPGEAQLRRLSEIIDVQKRYSHLVSPWHKKMSENLPVEPLVHLYRQYADQFRSARKKLVKIKNIEYELVARLSRLDQYHYDFARKMVYDIYSNKAVKKNVTKLGVKLKQALLPELINQLQDLLVEHVGVKEKKFKKSVKDVFQIEELEAVLVRLLETVKLEDPEAELNRVHSMISQWCEKVDKLVDHYFEKHQVWSAVKKDLQQLISQDELLKIEYPQLDTDAIYHYFRWLMPRLENTPHLKDLDKPTIVLVSGTSGVGKSTISQHISKNLGIPTSFSSDVASRSVMREAITFLLGHEAAKNTFPEIFGSSFDQDSLDWFYAHAMMTMTGVIGNIDRLIKENVSAVIDGVALIPGTLPEEYFERANIVWIVASIEDESIHLQRLGTRSETGVERGGSERYRKKIAAIRSNHDRLLEMGRRAGFLCVDNSDEIDKVLGQVTNRVTDPFADRGLPIEDVIRDRTQSLLQERATWEVQKLICNIEDGVKQAG